MDNFKEDEFEDKISEEVSQAGRVFADRERKTWGNMSPTWEIAGKIVTKVKPIPWIFWVMIRSVYGSSDKKLKVDPMSFNIVENLLIRSIDDPLLKMNEDEKKFSKSISGSVEILGSETVASLCFIHSICMRLSGKISERVYRAIIDDALIRARIGCLIGKVSEFLGVGKPLLAGFAGRAGLAVQLASGNDDQAKKALNGLATGKDISKMGIEVYGCDPLQVAALTLISAGCSKNIAFGISEFSVPNAKVDQGPEQILWLNIFSAIEYLRMNKPEMISESCWTSLGVDNKKIDEVISGSKNIFRTGHEFHWITKSLSQMI